MCDTKKNFPFYSKPGVMVQSNILSVFTGGESVKEEGGNNSSNKEFIDTECIPCTIVQLITAIGLGIYFQADHLFKEADGSIDLKKHPKLWQYSIRTMGLGLIGLGAQRAYHVYTLKQKFE